MPYIKPECVAFYLDGREQKTTKPMKQFSIEELAADAQKSDKPFALFFREAADAAMTPLRSGIPRQRWLEENASDIRDAGVDSSAAYDAFLKGRVDELASELQEAVLQLWFEEFDEDDGSEDGKDDEGDEEDEEEEAEH